MLMWNKSNDDFATYFTDTRSFFNMDMRCKGPVDKAALWKCGHHNFGGQKRSIV